MQADVLATFQFVAQLDLDAISLIGANGQGLNPLRLHARDHRAGIESFFFTRFTIFRFFRSHFVGEQNDGMMTTYFLDGDRLLMTHYCEAGNQPNTNPTKGSRASYTPPTTNPNPHNDFFTPK